MLVTHCGLTSRLFWIGARRASPWLSSGFCERLSQDASVGRGDSLKGEDMDEKLVELFMKWLKAFESMQAATKEKDLVAAHKAISQLKSQIAATPAEGLRGLVVKLGLHQFLNDHADAASLQVNSAYADLVRLTGHDPATEICDRFEREAA